MEGKCIAVCIFAGVLGLIAAVMGFAAEGTRIKAKQVGFTAAGTCVYPNSPSMALGIVAAIILLIEQILISGATGCFCCRGTPTSCPSTCKGITGLVCFIFSWLVFVGAFVALISAAILNNGDTLAKSYTVDDHCPLNNSNFFIVAGVLCVVSVTLGLISYIALISNDKKTISRGGDEHGIATAKPQMPTTV
ncbi:hypothetical protein RDABS01_013009 [Bienertia sinuspersici]